MNEVKGRYAVVTGGTGGIGAATARLFAAEGAAGIVVADINAEGAVQLCSDIEKDSACRCLPCRTDVASPADIEALFRLAMERFGRVDILVNCAGICPVGSVAEIDAEKWDRTLSINLRGAYLCSREAMAVMKKQEYGKIVSITSISGQIGGIATGINYAVSKGGLISMTFSLAKEGGPHHITCNAVSPGYIRTEMTRGFSHFDPKTVPLGHIGEPEEVADAILFLASDRSRYVTGNILNVNGGVYMSS